MTIMTYVPFALRALLGPLLCLAASMSATPAAAGLLGTSMTLTVTSPRGTIFGPTATIVIDPGVEFSIVGGAATVDITDSTMTLRFTFPDWNSDPLTFAFHSDTAGAFTGVSFASNSFPTASFTASSTDLNFYCCTGSSTNYPVTNFTAVFTGLTQTKIPEPGTAALLGVALAGIAARRRR